MKINLFMGQQGQYSATNRLISRIFNLLVFSLIFSHSFGCISSGDPARKSAAAANHAEAAKLRRTEQQADNTVISKESSEENGAEKGNANEQFEVDQAFVREYLQEFGHLSQGATAAGVRGQLAQGIKHFQDFMGFKPTGRVDLPTLARMSWKRCANTDEAYTGPPQIWERTTLFWFLERPIPNEFPFALQDMKELIRQAFAAWEIVIAMDFLEAQQPNDAQIIFGIGQDENNKNKTMNGRRGKTGLGIASTNNSVSPKLSSRIWLNKHENWSTFQTQEEAKIDIFLVLIHQIGHSLGLKHSGDDQSVMFPMFERPVGEQLPVISNDDVERLRALYETSETSADASDAAAAIPHGRGGHSPPLSPLPSSSFHSSQQQQQPSMAITNKNDNNNDKEPEKCPHSIWAAANVNQTQLYIFNGGNTWLFKDGKLAEGPNPIDQVFPDGPDHVDVAFNAGRLTVLIKAHTLFGYEFNAESGKFTRAKGFPRELHNRILFFPEAAFPIANGSIILIKDKVFATYNAETNTPHMLGNVDEFFPNLPEGLRSGFPANNDFSIYHMLTPEYAFLYDVRLTRPVGSQSIGQFLGCDGGPTQIPKQPSPSAADGTMPKGQFPLPLPPPPLHGQPQQHQPSTTIQGHGPPGNIQKRR